MNRLPWLFWSAAAVDAALIAAVVLVNPDAGHHDGGREMGIFFFAIVPAVVWLSAVAMFAFGGSIARPIATLVVLLPGLYFTGQWLDDRSNDRRSAERQSGAGYFRGDAMRRMGIAVVQHDLATLQRLAPQVDVNATGTDGMTLLALAVDTDFHRASAGSDDLSVVRALLALGARPDQGIDSALKRPTPALLSLLLEAGADPNGRQRGGEPLVFSWLSVMPPASLRALAAHGLDLDSRSNGDPLALVATIHERWDLLALLIELGADIRRPRADGRNVPDELKQQLGKYAHGSDVPKDLLHASALLNDQLETRR